jgi:hypothetical protein
MHPPALHRGSDPAHQFLSRQDERTSPTVRFLTEDSPDPSPARRGETVLWLELARFRIETSASAAGPSDRARPRGRSAPGIHQNCSLVPKYREPGAVSAGSPQPWTISLIRREN